MNEVEQINANLKEVGAQLRALAPRQDEIQNRLQTLEQVVATGQSRGASGQATDFSPIGARAVQDLEGLSAFTDLQGWNKADVRVNLSGSIRAALTNTPLEPTSDGSYMPSRPERGGIVGPVTRPLRLLDILPSRPTTADAVDYVQLSAEGEAAEQEKEGDAKTEIAFSGELKRAEIATIAGWTPASRQVLSDHAALQSMIGNVLSSKVLDRLESQLVNGPGGQGKIDGLVRLGTPFVPAIGASPVDIIGEAISSLAEYGYQPSAILMNPLDWLKIQITRDEEGGYLFGSPTQPAPPVLWNRPVVLTKSVDEGRALVFDTAYVTLLDRERASVMLSNSHADFFVRNLVAILGELRAGLEVRDTRAVYVMDLVTSGS